MTLLYRLINTSFINPISNRFTSNRRYTSDELSTWVEQSQDLMRRSTVSFLIVTYLGTFLSLNHLSNCIFPCPLLFFYIYALHAGYLFVTDTLSTPTITETPWVECQDLLIPTRPLCLRGASFQVSVCKGSSSVCLCCSWVNMIASIKFFIDGHAKVFCIEDFLKLLVV